MAGRTSRRRRTHRGIGWVPALIAIVVLVALIAAVATWIGQPLELGVDSGAMVVLTVSFLLAMLSYGLGRVTILSGIVHLIMFAIYLLLIFAP